jgi:hypothetical protein
MPTSGFRFAKPRLPGPSRGTATGRGCEIDYDLLDETLVVVMSEMGRTPRVNANAGRDHWTYCYGTLLAGAGIKGGSVCGASDAQAAFVKDRPVRDGLRVPEHRSRHDRAGAQRPPCARDLRR